MPPGNEISLYSDNQRKQIKLSKKKEKIKMLKAENERLKSELIQIKASNEIKLQEMQERINNIEEKSMQCTEADKKFISLQKEFETLNDTNTKKEQREAELNQEIENLNRETKKLDFKYQGIIAELKAEQEFTVKTLFYVFRI